MMRNQLIRLISLVIVFATTMTLQAQKANSPKTLAVIDNLRVEYTQNPIGIDVLNPRFSWQMTAPAGDRNYYQASYQIEVKDSKGRVFWNSKKNNVSEATGVTYRGLPLNAVSRYIWTVTVWDNKGNMSKGTDWFETGLMNSKIDAWDGATWIGGGNGDLVLYSKYLPLFILKYQLAIQKGSSRASVILGANDPRLMDRNKNILQIENGKDQSYFKVELDISGLNENPNGKANLNFYRVGYTQKDNASLPFKSFEIKTEFINNKNKYDYHKFAIRDQYGEVFVTLDDSTSFFIEGTTTNPGNPFRSATRGASVNLNPMGQGHDYLTFGMLCDMGFAVDSAQKAIYKDVTVTNIRNPANTLFAEDLAKPVYEGIYKAAASDSSSGLRIRNNTYE